MFIQSNIEAMQTWRNMVQVDRKFNQSLQKLSTGLALPSPEYGGGMFAAANDMEALYQNYLTGAKNVQDAKGWLEIGQTVMLQINDILLRMGELAHRSATETTNTDQRYEMNQEVQQLKSDIEILVQETKYNEVSVWGGTDGAGRTISIVFGENRQFAVSVYSVDLSDLNILNTSVGTANDASNAMGSITSAVTILSGLIARMGAQILEIDAKATILDEQAVQEKAMESRVNELDFAKEMKTFTSLQVVLQASNAMISQANMKAQMVSQLFG